MRWCVVYPLLNPDRKSKLSLFIEEQDYQSKQLFRLGGGCVGAGGSGGQRAAQQHGFSPESLTRSTHSKPHPLVHLIFMSNKEHLIHLFFMHI